jgi:hypothetical protein
MTVDGEDCGESWGLPAIGEFPSISAFARLVNARPLSHFLSYTNLPST